MANSCNIDKTDSPENKYSVVRFDISCSKTNQCPKNKDKTFCMMWCPAFPFVSELKQYIGVITFGVLLWGSSWFLFKDDVLPGGYLFEMSALIISGYVCGHTLERYTTLNPVVGMTLTGVLWRNFSSTNFLQHPIADSIDYHLRRIYPVIILTKGPLTWNWQYIKTNSLKVFSLATLPWIVECLSSAVLTHLFLGFSWYWAIHLGAILSSVSPAIVVPTTIALSKKGLGLKNQIALLVANAGGLDTAFTEGMFGVINSAIFYSSPLFYRIIKALLAIFVGIGLGVVWAIFLDFVPDHKDIYAPTIRSLLIFAGGLFITYVGGYYGWGGTSGVAIMVCAGAAATRWDRRDWPINNNPVSEVYKLLWRIFEPMLFTLSGYFLEVSQITARESGLIVACIFSALFIRMLAAFLIALANRLTVKESLFIAITWMPKAIVEKCSGLQTRIKTKFRTGFADQIMLLLILLHIDFETSLRAVLVRVATDSLWSDGTTQDQWIASQHANIIVIAILLTSTLGSVLTTTLGPILLSREIRVSPAEEPQTLYPYQPTAPPEQTTF